jgi:3-hydroxybutyryl-CoA dehydrogenase
MSASGLGGQPVGIVGYGVIGALLSAAWTSVGARVRLTDTDPRRLVTATSSHDLIETVTTIEELTGCAVVIEAVTEDLAQKRDVLSRLTAPGVIDPAAVVLTTTSAFTVTELSSAVRGPQRFAGLHVLATSAGIRLAEIAAGAHTSPDTAGAVEDLARVIGLTPLRVADRPGRLTRRLLVPFVNQAVQAFDDGLASAADLDLIAELGLGHRRGPLSVLEAAGIADHLRAARAMYDAVADPALAPPPLLARLAAAGDGRGFDRAQDTQTGHSR